MTTPAPTIALWITDTTMTDWRDTERLEATMPTHRWPRAIADALDGVLDARLEGLADPRVSVGNAVVTDRPGGLWPEADWAIVFGGPLATLGPIGYDTPCVLQGVIRGTWARPMAESGTLLWRDAAIGGSLLGGRAGIATTLGDLHKGIGAGARAVATVEWKTTGGDTRRHAVHGEDLRRIPLKALIDGVADWSATSGVPVSAVALGCGGELSGFAAMSEGDSCSGPNLFAPFFRGLLKASSLPPGEVLALARAHAWRSRIERGDTARPDAGIHLTVSDGNGRLAGEGHLLVADFHS